MKYSHLDVGPTPPRVRGDDEPCAAFAPSPHQRWASAPPSSPPTSPINAMDELVGTGLDGAYGLSPSAHAPRPPLSSSSLESSSENQTDTRPPRTRSDDHMATRDTTSPSAAAVATSMLAMRAEPPPPPPLLVASEGLVDQSVRTRPESSAATRVATALPGEQTGHEKEKMKDDGEGHETTSLRTRKTKVSRERQLKINAASRRCRKKQKLELQFLRTHVQELHAALMDQVKFLQRDMSQQQRATRLAHFVQDSVQKVAKMSSGMRMDPAATPVAFRSELLSCRIDEHSEADSDGTHGSDLLNYIETDDAHRVRTIDPSTRYSLSDERKKELLHISSFVLVNISSESNSFAPDVISCLPIELDGWQLRLAITEKSYTIHNQKFFPCNVDDMFDFCWETNVAQKISIKHAKKHYVVVTPLEKDVAHVHSKTTGKWSLNVHGVPNVSYNSIVCRRYMSGERRAIICQQSVLEERDFQDENTLPWLFKRWVVFRPKVQDGVAGTFVEAYRTASYATGRLIYKDNKKYDSFCEHLIRRYAESNLLLESMMARDKRFAHAFDDSVRLGTEARTATVSDRILKDLLLF